MSNYPRKYERVGDAPNALTVAESTWDDAAFAALSSIFAASDLMREGTLNGLRSMFDGFIDRVFGTHVSNNDATIKWINIGATALKIAAERGEEFYLTEVHKIVVGKQRDYGPENIRRFGRNGILVRMHDKIARLENLLNIDGGGKPNNESIKDNLMDVVGYSCVAIMWEQDKFLLPLKK